jgi:hypothetical protein
MNFAISRQTIPEVKAYLRDTIDMLEQDFGFSRSTGTAQLDNIKSNQERIIAYGKYDALCELLEDLES